MSKARKRSVGESACLDGRSGRRRCSALAIFAATAAGGSGQLLGRGPAGDADAEQFQRLKRGGVDSIRIPIDWGAVQPTQGGPLNWSGVDGVVKGAADAGIEVLPFLTGAPAWAVPRSASPARQPSKRLPPAGHRHRRDRLVELRQRRGPPLRAQRQLLGRKPGRAEAPDPHLADLERGELQVLRRQAQPGRIRQAGEALLRGDEKRRSRRQADPRRHVRAPEEATLQRKSRSAAYFAADFLEQMYETTPGIKSKFNGVALHPYTGKYQELTAEDRRIPRRSCAKTTTPPRASGSPSSAGAPDRPAPTAQHLRQGPRRPGHPAQRRLLAARAQAGEMEAPAGLLVLGRRPARHLQLLRRLRPLRPRLRARRSPGIAYVKFAGGTP